MWGRNGVGERVAQLDAHRDYAEIYRALALEDFAWDHQRALELALFRTYCVPSIGGLLERTQEFVQRPQKRYDDTVLLLEEVLVHGFESDRGRQALRRINRIHGRFDITNDDMRYVLSTFVAVPIRWLDRFGWRRLTDQERVATHEYYRALGHRMGIRDIPSTWHEMIAFSDDYERAHFAANPATARVADASRELLVSWLRPVPAPAVRVAVTAMLDEPVLRAAGFRPAPRWVRAAAAGALRTRARLLRLLPPRRRPWSVARSRSVRGYAGGYEIGSLGPDGSPLPGATQPAPARETRTAPT